MRCLSEKILHHKLLFPVHIIVQLLESCIQSKSLIEGKIIHKHILTSGPAEEIHSVLLDKLTHLYGTCGQVEVSRRVFDKIPDPNVVLCDMMIRGYACEGPLDGAIDLYGSMLDRGLKRTKFTFPFVLKACSGLRALEDGMKIHGHALRLGLDSDAFVSTALINLYTKCGGLVEAKRVFDSMAYRDVVAWNAMIAGFSFHGLCEEVIGLFVNMQEAGLSPNSSTIVSILPTIAHANELSQGKAMHGYCLRKSFSNDVVVGTGLLDMYGKCRCLPYAQRIFVTMGVKNEVTWTAMISAYVICDATCEALELFDQMVENATSLNRVTLGSILRACAKLTDPSRGRKLHCYILKIGLAVDLMVGNTLLSMYSKCGIIKDAFSFFNEMSFKDSVSYNAIISGWVQSGNDEEAFLTFREMRLRGFDLDLATMVGILPACSHLATLKHGACCHGYSIARGFSMDTSICNTLIDMYSKCGKIDLARKVFDRTPKRDIVSWNAMILGYGIHGHGMDAVSLFQNLCIDSELKPDCVTFICLLMACSHSGLVSEGKHWFDAMSGKSFNIVPTMEHYICMTDLLGRAGNLEEAHDLIREMPFEADVRVWGALLAACRIHKNVELGEEILKRIQSLGPPQGTGTFTLMSDIYSRMGRWDEATHVRIIERDSGIKKGPGISLLG